ncbi:luciferase family oxidoreductase group 1 [Bacillus mesophilus]|uniref:LLM class flavin-dependent oxidoreductase n=1 Tax=Bacillus mesophilus TaxID=1808955 RepID=A0A6M0Q981_9BACI|nr:LLM class flavin-dependent oxidoreductase [Bacillus mesophilus]MBM7661840.1 luciferase family oxidoreductase group 1 [Bacillus mesophilus]NEY72797.1 LLM class flavin-dependent oxidoreductase [Bacillus mesophilus]
MRLSILDQSPISSNQTAREALTNSMKLAQAGEALGYTRYWIAEHHDLPGLACPAPEVMLGYIGAHTNTIRIGSGATLLPHYKPYKVAETYNMLATLFPDRIDLGIGRAPGGSAEATNALNDNFLQKVYDMPNSVKELLHFIHNDLPSDHQHAKVTASPLPKKPPVLWLLGTSKKSAILAAENGLSYTFGKFMSDQDGIEIIKQYRDSFKLRKKDQKPDVILTVSAFCAETTEQAEEIATSALVWSLQLQKDEGHRGIPSIKEAMSYELDEKEKESIKQIKSKMIIGCPREVKQGLEHLQKTYQADEIMMITNTHRLEDKIRSYELIAQELEL